MIQLVPMTQAEFDTFLEHDIRTYAQANTQAGYWDQTSALEKSRREHKRLLPDGLKTRDHFLYIIRNDERRQVGVVWMKIDLSSQKKPSGIIFDLEIDPPYQHKGYATQAMHELEKIALGLGLVQLSLHVFAYNTVAHKLYEKLGYTISSFNMIKPLGHK